MVALVSGFTLHTITMLLLLLITTTATTSCYHVISTTITVHFVLSCVSDDLKH